MASLSELVDCLKALAVREDSWSERWDNLTLQGVNPTSDTIQCLEKIFTCCLALHYEPEIYLDDDLCSIEEIREAAQDSSMPRSWRVVVHKPKILDALPPLRPDEQRILFLSGKSFMLWAGTLSAFKKCEIDFSKPTTIIVAGLASAFGGSALWIVPVSSANEFDPPRTVPPKLPTGEAVHKLIHVISDQAISVNPAAFALNWGDLSLPEATIFLRIYAVQLAACLAQDLYVMDGVVRCSIKGTKRLDLLLENRTDAFTLEAVTSLANAVIWVYEERSETRQKLISDPLSIDLAPNESLISGLSKHLNDALKQAKDRYAFVILDRKDAYYKELRDIMKDVRSQADLYASKVRDLVNALFRDLLGVLILIGVSLIAKFDPTKMALLSSSAEVILFFKILAGYFVLSFLFQLVSHGRDVSLAWSESNGWLDLMRDYTSDAELEDRFRKPLRARRRTFWATILAVGCLYVMLALVSWNFAAITSCLLKLG